MDNRIDADRSSGPLRGIRVLSLAEQLPGPYATLLLADLGAEVVLVERPDGGDPARVHPEFFAALGRNKRSVCLDLKTPDGLARFRVLAAEADVIVEGYSVGTAERLGIGYETLRADNPRLVYASISGFGQTGPARGRPAHDLSFQAISGVLTAQALGPGRVPGLPLGDMCAALYAALAICAALHGRAASGAGTAIDVAISESLAAFATPLLVPRLNGGPPLGIAEQPAYGLFACADGAWLSLSIAHEEKFWRSLCAVLALPPESAELDMAGRAAVATTLRGMIGAAIAERSLAQWAEVLDAARIPWSPVHDLDAVPRDLQFAARSLFESLSSADGMVETHLRSPLHFSAWGRPALTPAPRLGEHER